MGPTKWGIISCGKISHDFVTAVRTLPNDEHVLQAAAARNLESAKEFAAKHGISTAYGSYEQLHADKEVEVVYVGSINPQHITLVKLAINAGKAVLCEKPMGINLKETQELVELARQKKVFLMEGIWSRFFPVYRRLEEELKKGSVGEVVQVIVNFCTLLTHKDRCSLKELGGGTILDIGVYCVQFASFVFGGETPTKILAAGHLNKDGVDESTSTTLLYPNGKTATLITHARGKYECEAAIVGTTGVIKVPFRFWCPTELVTPSGLETFDLPKTDLPFNYANSVGLSYEAQEVRQCLQNGLTESKLMSLDETLLIAEIMESIRKQVGVVYPQDL